MMTHRPTLNTAPILWSLAITVAVVSVIGFAGHHFGPWGIVGAVVALISVFGSALFLACAHVGARSEGR